MRAAKNLKRYQKKTRYYKDESDGCIDTWIEVIKLHFERKRLDRKTEMHSAQHQNGRNSPELRGGEKTISAKKILLPRKQERLFWLGSARAPKDDALRETKAT